MFDKKRIRLNHIKSFNKNSKRVINFFETISEILIEKIFDNNQDYRSKNILEAVSEAKKKKMQILSFTGNTKNNKLAEASALSFQAPSSNTALIQELHTIIGHEVCLSVEKLMLRK